jgi:hypothetical protein
MKSTYRILADVIAGLVVVQAALIVYLFSALDKYISDGATITPGDLERYQCVLPRHGWIRSSLVRRRHVHTGGDADTGGRVVLRQDPRWSQVGAVHPGAADTPDRAGFRGSRCAGDQLAPRSQRLCHVRRSSTGRSSCPSDTIGHHCAPLPPDNDPLASRLERVGCGLGQRTFSQVLSNRLSTRLDGRLYPHT